MNAFHQAEDLALSDSRLCPQQYTTDEAALLTIYPQDQVQDLLPFQFKHQTADSSGFASHIVYIATI